MAFVWCAGGPLGELVQWSDILAALHVLGHRVEIVNETHFTRYRHYIAADVY